jgi:16S rRNA G966 N2-methylase RsmD
MKNNIQRLIKRLMRNIKREGIIVTLYKIPLYLYYKLNPAIRLHEKVLALRAEEFDRNNNITTAGTIYQTDLGMNNKNQIHALQYRGSDFLFFNNALSFLKINFNDYTFIDFGAGKGKALFLASAYSFKKIIGIEFSEELNAVAQENIRQFKKDNIEAYCMDVVDYKIPEESLVCYFYNPFDEYIMAKVISNIRQAYNLYKKNIVIVYTESQFHDLFDAEKWLERLSCIGTTTIWSSIKNNLPT